jgi:hypothetical protein
MGPQISVHFLDFSVKSIGGSFFKGRMKIPMEILEPRPIIVSWTGGVNLFYFSLYDDLMGIDEFQRKLLLQ